jgi:protein TonB
MDTNKILSADLLDLIFDDRNKAYGAYDLRKTYSTRIKKSLLITVSVVGLAFTGAALVSNAKKDSINQYIIPDVLIATIPDEKLPIPEPEIRQPEPEPETRTEQLTNMDIVKDEDVLEPPPTQDDLADAKIDVKKQDGVIDDGTVIPDKPLDDGKGIIDVPKNTEPDIFEKVEIDAKFAGNWEKFLTRNLNPNTPVDNGAAPGNYVVLVQFVVDVDGSVSQIKPISNVGYGMEEEAVRVLRKAEKWVPAIQNGRQVKAWRTQKIVFQVLGDE